MSTTVEGVLNAMDVIVAGIVNTGVPEVNKRLVMVHLETAQSLLDTNKVSRLSVYLEDLEKSKVIQNALTEEFSQYEFRNWEDEAHFYHKVRDLYQVIFGVVGIVILVIVFFAIHNTLAMVTLERTREIGTLAALGTRKGEISSFFIAEAFLIGLIGSILGAMLAGFVSISLFFIDVQMPPPPGSTEGYPLYIYFDFYLALIVSVAVILGALAAAWLSTKKIISKPIVEALRDV